MDQRIPPLSAAEDPRVALAELVAQIHGHFSGRLVGLHLFGSLAAGGFYPGRSDLDLWAVLAFDVQEGDDLDSLRALHERFEHERPSWRDRIEVLYVSRDVLQTFSSQPTGFVARISPGEAMHRRDLAGDIRWLVDWHSVLSVGETLLGPSPSSLGPPVPDELFQEAVRSELRAMRELVRQNEVAYVPAHQGYIVATVSRALYTIATGEDTSKGNAVAWLAERRPEIADFLWTLYHAYRAEVGTRHTRLIRFVDEISEEAATGIASFPANDEGATKRPS